MKKLLLTLLALAGVASAQTGVGGAITQPVQHNSGDYTLDQIGNPAANVSFSVGSKTITLNYSSGGPIYFSSTGQLGIGSSSISQPLHIKLSGNAFYQVESTGGNTAGGVFVSGSDSWQFGDSAFGMNGFNFAHQSGSDSNVHLSIQSSGSSGYVCAGGNISNTSCSGGTLWVGASTVAGKVGSSIASASTIAPASPIVHVTGTTAIATITAPTECASSGFGCQITLIPDGAFTTTTAGNIAIASTAVVSKAMVMTYDNGTSKWYPSY